MATPAYMLLLLSTVAVARSEPDGAKRQLNIFHISDLHLDRRYQSGGAVDHWCHAVSAADSAEPAYADLAPWGNYSCDAPAVLVESAIRFMHKRMPDPDLIVWTGDSSPHWKEGPDFDYIFANFKNISGMLHTYFGGVPVVPALGNHDTDPPDYYPDTLFDKSGNYSDFYSKYIEEGAIGDFIQDPQARADFKKCGYYSLRPRNDSNVRFVVLNTNLYYSNGLLPEGDVDDPCQQLQWLRAQLEAAEEDEHIFVAAHVPPGFHERNISRPMFNVAGGDAIAGRMADIFRDKRLTKNVVAQFYGHTHTDAFRLFLDGDGRVMSTAFIQASVTPSLYKYHTPFGVNPSIRLYNYSDGVIQDYEQFFLDLGAFQPEQMRGSGDRRDRNSKFLRGDHGPEEEDGGEALEEVRSKRDDTDDDHRLLEPQQPQGPEDGDDSTGAVDQTDVADQESVRPEDIDPYTDLLVKLVESWKFYYRASEAFSEDDLSRKSMAKILLDMKGIGGHNDTIFKLFYKHNTVNHFPSPADAVCDKECWCKMTCSITSFTIKEITKCLDNTCGFKYTPPAGMEAVSSSNATTVPPLPEPETTMTTAPPDAQTTEEVDEATAEPEGGADKTQSVDGGGAEAPSSSESESAEPVVTSVPADHSLRGAAIGFCIVVVLAIAVGGLLIFRRVQSNRYRAQEFLLTDSVFRYDGYDRVDGP